MKIIKLTVSNVKRIRVVEITPDGKSIIIGGKNGAGKTSLIDAIAATFGGKKLCPKVPIRKGADKGESRVETEDLIITRTWTPGESNVVVSNKDGSIHRSPQKILDAVVGPVTFDPLEFSRMDPGEQLATLQNLVGLDFTKLDGQRAGAYANRRDIKRDLKSAAARLDALTHHDDAPASEVSIADLVTELERRRAHNQENDRKAAEHVAALEDVIVAKATQKKCGETIEALEEEHDRKRAAMLEEMGHAIKRRVAAETCIREFSDVADQQGEVVGALESANESEIHDEIAGAEGKNLKLRDNEAHDVEAARVHDLSEQAEALTTKIAGIDEEKKKVTAAAAYPIEGLAVEDAGVTFNGLPLEQASSAELLRISAAMGFALNPTLRVLLIRDGSLLDEDSLALLLSMAEAADTQLWIERVGEGGASVVIEDGAVKG